MKDDLIRRTGLRLPDRQGGGKVRTRRTGGSEPPGRNPGTEKQDRWRGANYPYRR